MTSIRIGAETHQELKQLANKQGSKLTELLHELVSLLANTALSPAQIQAKLTAAGELADFQKLLVEQRAKMLKVIGGQERNYLFPFLQELARLKECTEQLVAGQMDIAERLHHIEQLIQETKQALDKQYQLLMEV